MFNTLKTGLRTGLMAAAVTTVAAFSAQAASVTVIADVNADSSKASNANLYDGILGTSSSVLFSRADSQQDDTLNFYNGKAGVSATESAATLTASLLNTIDLLVVTTQFANSIFYSAAEYSAVADFVSGGGDVLVVLESSSSSQISGYNAFLTGIGSSIQYLTTRTVAVANDTALENTGVSDASMSFRVDAYGHLFGGETIGQDNGGNIFAATENFTPAVPLPAGLPLLVGGLMGFAGLRRMRRKS